MTPTSLIAILLGAELLLQPGSASPGDVVLVTVTGVDDAPTGWLGKQRLAFWESPPGYWALVGLSVDQKPGELPLTVEAVEDGARVSLGGTLEVREANFRRRSLTVAPRFTNPSAKEVQRSARDQRAFQKAFDQELEAFLFEGDFGWPRQDIVAAPFGDLRVFNGKRQSQHMGSDLDGEVGDPVAAANDGEVVMARDCFGSGNTVLIHHGGRLFTAYFHLSRVDVKVGDPVTRGQRLGLVGSTGRVTGPHLHFGVKLDGRWVNPESLLSLRFETASDRATPVDAAP